MLSENAQSAEAARRIADVIADAQAARRDSCGLIVEEGFARGKTADTLRSVRNARPQAAGPKAGAAGGRGKAAWWISRAGCDRWCIK